MGYRLKRREGVVPGIRRVLCEQAERAIAILRNPSCDADVAVHDVRRRMKKSRAAVRLIRPALGENYATENKFFRDLARHLATARDATVVPEAFARLVQDLPQIQAQSAATVRGTLQESRDDSWKEGLQEAVAEVAHALERVPRRVSRWRLDSASAGFLRGAKDGYARGRTALDAAIAHATDDNLHQWRKRVKDQWYQMRLLSGLWQPVLEVRRRELQRLAELLGDDHDLAVLRQQLILHRNEISTTIDTELLLDAVQARRRRLRRAAWPLGQRLYAESPSAFAARLRTYWQVWRR